MLGDLGLKVGSEGEKRGKEALLALADGTIFYGNGFGAGGAVAGEVVFNTGMVGYVESITDPSYNGQILTQTYPLIGNYGVCPDSFESDGPKITGYVTHELCRQPSHWSSKLSLDKWLTDNGIPGIEGIDTRMLTKKLRTHGTMLGILSVYENGDKPSIEKIIREVKRIPDPNKRDLAREVSTEKTIIHDAHGKYNVALIDCGVKRSIITNLLDRGINVLQMPIDIPADRILAEKPDSIVISNGPGDPKMVPYLIETVKSLTEVKLPILGICLGCQILALAFGADTFKLKFGHRGQNHTVMDMANERCYITSQNHGYAIDQQSLTNTPLEVTFLNVNDRTVEGVRHKTLPFFAVQFHPEASPGPTDTKYYFDDFLTVIERHKARK